jgi:hypothetical protein
VYENTVVKIRFTRCRLRLRNFFSHMQWKIAEPLRMPIFFSKSNNLQLPIDSASDASWNLRFRKRT